VFSGVKPTERPVRGFWDKWRASVNTPIRQSGDEFLEKDAGYVDCSDEYIATDRLYPDRSAGNGRKIDGLPTLVGRWNLLLHLQRL
jgi:hypothetical protein